MVVPVVVCLIVAAVTTVVIIFLTNRRHKQDMTRLSNVSTERDYWYQKSIDLEKHLGGLSDLRVKIRELESLHDANLVIANVDRDKWKARCSILEAGVERAWVAFGELIQKGVADRWKE